MFSEEFMKAAAKAVEETVERRASGEVEVERLRWGRWRWRFYWGQFKQHGGWKRWEDYETGTALTRQGALFAAARQLTKLQLKTSRQQEKP